MAYLCGFGKKLSQLATALLVSPPIPKTPKHQHRIFFSKLHQVERIVNEEKAGNRTTKKKGKKSTKTTAEARFGLFFPNRAPDSTNYKTCRGGKDLCKTNREHDRNDNIIGSQRPVWRVEGDGTVTSDRLNDTLLRVQV